MPENAIGQLISFNTRGGKNSIPIVAKYTHVGNALVAGGSVSHDVAVKSATITTNAKPFVKPLLTNPNLDTDKKVTLAKSIILSTGHFNAAVWPAQTNTEQRRHQTAVLRVYRHIAAMERWRKIPGTNDAAVLTAVAVPMPRLRLMIARTKLLARIV